MGSGEGPSGRCSAVTQPWAELCWRPDACRLEPFSAVGFCARVAREGLRILVVGDSISYLFYQALLHQMDPSARIDDARGPGGQWHAGGTPREWWDPKAAGVGGALSICGGRGSLLLRRQTRCIGSASSASLATPSTTPRSSLSPSCKNKSTRLQVACPSDA